MAFNTVSLPGRLASPVVFVIPVFIVSRLSRAAGLKEVIKNT
jgi:hypothetical protein